MNTLNIILVELCFATSLKFIVYKEISIIILITAFLAMPLICVYVICNTAPQK